MPYRRFAYHPLALTSPIAGSPYRPLVLIRPIVFSHPPAIAATTVISSPGLTGVAKPCLKRMSSSFK